MERPLAGIREHDLKMLAAQKRFQQTALAGIVIHNEDARRYWTVGDWHKPKLDQSVISQKIFSNASCGAPGMRRPEIMLLSLRIHMLKFGALMKYADGENKRRSQRFNQELNFRSPFPTGLGKANAT